MASRSGFMGAPLTAAELVKHPEFKNVTWKLEPASKGVVAVASGRGGPIHISYEIHGNGPKHLVWVMGLGGFLTSWQRTTRDFGHDHGDEYSCLVFDNRGMGKSDKPLLRYTTSELAKDTLELADHVGWTSEKELHVIGVSMGGMIAQEMAYLAPQRIASLSLISTAARLINTVGYLENLRNRINMFIPKDIDAQLIDIKSRLFTESYIDAPDIDGKWPTNGDRYAASEVSKRMDTEGFTRRGFLLQAIAAGWHHKSAAQLKQIGDAIGRERIQVMHGSCDKMITVSHGQTLIDELGDKSSSLTGKIYEEVGHVIPMERREDFRKSIMDLVHKANTL